jgi:hypothetical protein
MNADHFINILRGYVFQNDMKVNVFDIVFITNATWSSFYLRGIYLRNCLTIILRGYDYQRRL